MGKIASTERKENFPRWNFPFMMILKSGAIGLVVQW
jgi:hypothetical protein